MKRIAIVNMSGARNRGCEALVDGAIKAIGHAVPSGDFTIDLHTEDPTFDNRAFGDRVQNVYRQYPLLFSRHGYNKPLNRTAYRLGAEAERFAKGPLGKYRSLSNMRKADLLVVTGGDILTSDYNALSAYLSPLHVGKPTVILGHTVGPFKGRDEEYFVKSLENVRACTVRETTSLSYLQQLAPQLQTKLVADIAFDLDPVSDERVHEILEIEHRFPIDEGPMIGLSISAGILSFKEDVKSDEYFKALIKFVDDMNEEGYRFVFIPHVQEKSHHNNDMFACLEVFRKVKNHKQNVVLSTPLNASDYKGVIGKCAALVGARTHTTIASMSQGIPTVAIAYSRKAWGVMADYYGEEQARKQTIDVADLTTERLTSALKAALDYGKTPEKAKEMKLEARKNYDALSEVVAAL